MVPSGKVVGTSTGKSGQGALAIHRHSTKFPSMSGMTQAPRLVRACWDDTDTLEACPNSSPAVAVPQSC